MVTYRYGVPSSIVQPRSEFGRDEDVSRQGRALDLVVEVAVEQTQRDQLFGVFLSSAVKQDSVSFRGFKLESNTESGRRIRKW